MKYLKLLHSIILISFFLGSCVYNKTKDVYLPEDAKQYIMYNKGSYVVLNNDSLNLFDTIKSENIEYTWQEDFDSEIYQNFNYELLTAEYFSSYFNCKIYEKLYYMLGSGVYDFKFKRSDSSNIYSFVVSFYSINKNFNEGEKNIEININSINYSNVLNINSSINKDSTWASYYYAPNIGLIRKIYHYPTHEMKWDMVSYYNSGQPAQK